MIRRATAHDFQAIKSIKAALGIDRERLQEASYRFSLQRNGFLLFPDLEHSEFVHDLSKLFLVYEAGQAVIGFIRIDAEQEIGSTSNVMWLRIGLRSRYFAKPHADIGIIAVLPTTNHKGVGTALLEAAEKELRKLGIPRLFSLVVLAPITNIPSLLFHEKHGFERVAVTSHSKLFGLRNYQSVLYGKELL